MIIDQMGIRRILCYLLISYLTTRFLLLSNVKYSKLHVLSRIQITDNTTYVVHSKSNETVLQKNMHNISIPIFN